jgi:hypothetical protein
VLIKAGVASPPPMTWFFEEIRRFRKNSTDFNEKDI